MAEHDELDQLRGDPAPGPLKNCRITDARRLGEGGAKTKAQDKLEAIRVLKRLAAESRPADGRGADGPYQGCRLGDTVLANNAFPVGSRFNPGWEAIGASLRSY